MPSPISKADKTLSAAAAFWFLVALTGQWLFVYYIALVYGGSAIQGDFEKWNTVLFHGFMNGDIVGNLILAAHIFLAFIITFGGPLQLIPFLRRRAMTFHRWNGRLYIGTAFLISAAGLYLIFARGVIGGGLMMMGNILNASLIMICAAMCWRTAVAHKLKAHRRWALRTFLMVNGVWFFRIGFGLWIFLNNGSAPGSTEDLQGPFDVFLAFAHSLLPLAILELYLYAKEHTAAPARYAMAISLVLLSFATGIGIFMAAQIFWLPNL